MDPKDFPLQNNLMAMGFSEKEATVYISSLELGKGTVSQIARKAAINRTTAYHILGSLVNKGLVVISGKEPKQEYVAEPPEKIINMFNNYIKTNENYIKEAKELIPKLKSIHNVRGRPQIRFYEGKEGVKQVYEDTLTSHEAIRAFAHVEDNNEALPQYFPDYFFRRAAKKIPIRAIFVDSPDARELIKFDKVQMRETALVPEKDYAFSPEINIYDNKIMIASWREELGITIESQEIARAMKKIFELAWKEAKRQDTATRQRKP